MCPLLFFSRYSNIHRLRHEIRSELGAIRQVLRSASAIANWLHAEFIANRVVLQHVSHGKMTAAKRAMARRTVKMRWKNGTGTETRREWEEGRRKKHVLVERIVEAKNEVLLSNAQKRMQQHSCNTRVREFPLRVYYLCRISDRLWFREERVQYTHEQLFRLSIVYSQLFFVQMFDVFSASRYSSTVLHLLRIESRCGKVSANTHSQSNTTHHCSTAAYGHLLELLVIKQETSWREDD